MPDPALRQAERLELRVGLASAQGGRPSHDDYAGMLLGTPQQRAQIGVLAALADGVGGSAGGRVAAETAVRGVVEAYQGLRETLGPKHNLIRAFEAMNSWIHAMGRTDPLLSGMATTLSALVLRGRQLHVAHVGDSRIYRLRGDVLVQLTQDHVPADNPMRNRLSRAIGAAEAVSIDYLLDETREHDRYLLCSDGVHGALSDGRLRAMLAERSSADDTAQNLVTAALDARIGDNATALVVDLLRLPPSNLADLEITLGELPLLPPPKLGAIVDGFDMQHLLADGRYSRVFRALDSTGGDSVILKFPKPAVGAEVLLRQAFLRESWIAAKVRSPFVGEVIDPGADRRSCLYTVMPFYPGETLEERLTRPPRLGLGSGLEIALRLSRAVAALHRAGIVHRDIKPENVILPDSGGLRLIDLGVARLPFLEDETPSDVPGTASYMAPELFAGGAGDALSDQFALAVTIYRMFAGAYPYGEIEKFSHPRFTRPAPLGQHRPDLPAWLEETLARALSPNPEERFEDVVEFAFELEHGVLRAAPGRPRRRPLYAQNPLRFWQFTSAVLLALLLLTLNWATRR